MDLDRLYTAVMAREDLRRSSGLPPLDVAEELTRAYFLNACERHHAATEPFASLRETIRDEILRLYTERGLTGRALALRAHRDSNRQYKREMEAVGLFEPTQADCRNEVQRWLAQRAT